jgi:hypothetical protein
MLGKFRLITNSPLPADPLPVVSFVMVKSKVFKVRSLMGKFHDEWQIHRWRVVIETTKLDFEHSE